MTALAAETGHRSGVLMGVVAEGRLRGELAVAERHTLPLDDGELDRPEVRSFVRPVAERLGLRPSAAAPLVGPRIERAYEGVEAMHRSPPRRRDPSRLPSCVSGKWPQSAGA